jgi:hypothetical protein
MFARFPWELLAYPFWSAERNLGTTGTNIQIFNNRTNIFKTLNDACEMRYFHILLQRDVWREPKTCSFPNHSLH